MSAQPVDVLAVMDDLFEDLTIAGNYSGEGCWFADGEEARAKARYDQARAAVAELVEAGRELRDAQSDYDRLDAPGGKKWDRLCFARERHTAALARVQGGAG